MAIVARKGGVGKSTLAVLLARAYALSGAHVCVVDLDPQATATRVLTVADPVKGDSLGERLTLGEQVDDLVSETVFDRLSVLPSSEALSIHETRLASDPVGIPSVAQSIGSLLRGDFNLVIVDTPPSLGPLTFGSLMATRWAVVPTACEDASVQSLPNALRSVARARMLNSELEVLAVVPNRLERATRHGAAALEVMKTSFGRILAETVIPKAAAIADAMRPGCPLDERSRGAEAVACLAEELLRRMTSRSTVHHGQAADDIIDCDAVNALTPQRLAAGG
jgi:chromosome partitioning protein